MASSVAAFFFLAVTALATSSKRPAYASPCSSFQSLLTAAAKSSCGRISSSALTAPIRSESTQDLFEGSILDASSSALQAVSEAIMRIVREHRGETIVIASHGTAIQTFLNYAEGIPADKMGRYLLYNVSVCCVTVDEEDRTTLKFVDDKHHVPEELQFSYSSIPSK